MKKPTIVERFADNGEHSHYSLIETETGKLLWSEAPEEELFGVEEMGISIRDLCLSVKALNALASLEIKTLGDLIEYDIKDFLKLRNCGKVTCKEIEKIVETHGLKFKKEKRLVWSYKVE